MNQFIGKANDELISIETPYCWNNEIKSRVFGKAPMILMAIHTMSVDCHFKDKTFIQTKK